MTQPQYKKAKTQRLKISNGILKRVPYIYVLADTSTSWNGNEYLRIYPRIEENELRLESFKVIFPDGETKLLSEWLNL